MEEPRIFLVNELLYDLKNNIKVIEEKIETINEENSKMVYIYIYSLFEGTIWQALKTILNGFPEKCKLFELSLSSEANFNEIIDKYDILDKLIDKKLYSLSKNNLVNCIREFCDIEKLDLIFDDKKLYLASTSAGMNLLRGGSKSLINLLW